MKRHNYRQTLVFMITCILFGTAGVSTPMAQGLFQGSWRGFDTGVYGGGFGPASFATGDLDGDGKPDILAGDSFFGSTGISILKSNGVRSFAAPVYYSLPQGQTVGEVALADFDMDGDLDAFATIRGDFDQLLTVKIWRNNGTGTLLAPINFTTGQGPAGIVVGDFTGDGKPDVVTANFGASSISILKHNGQSGPQAAYLPPDTFAMGFKTEKMSAADLNGDGSLDVVAGGQNSSGTGATLAVMINGGSGNFGAASGYDPAPGATAGSSAMTLTDIDNDGDIDLIGGGYYSVGSGGYGCVTVRRNGGGAAFGEAQMIPFPSYMPTPKELTAGDVNGDGYPDIIAAVPSGRANEGFVAVLSNGSGGFSAPAYYEASQQTFDVAVLDLDGDGDRDVATLANSTAAVTVHENPGTGLFPQLPRYAVASLSDALEVADVDNDGDIDIVVNGEVDIASNFSIVKILKNNGNSTFAPPADYSPARNFADMKLRDINGDGFADLIFAPDGNYPPYHFGTALNLGNGTFAPTVVTDLFSCGEGSIDAADLDGDGDEDIVVTEEQSCIGAAPNRIFIMRNDGNQTFTRMTDIVVSGLPHGLTLADATSDGKIDVIIAQSQGMGVYPGNGNLGFGSAIISTTRPYKFRVADFNRDGKLDVGMIMPQDSFGTDTIATALGNGNGTFQGIRTQTGSSVLENLRISDDLEIADIDRDGRPDLVTFNYASNDLSLFAGNPDGSLQRHQRYGLGNTPHQGALADFNGDGKIDVAAAIGLPPSGLHDAIVVLPGAQQVVRKAAYDFDGDGKADLSVYRPSDGTWFVQQSQAGFLEIPFGVSSDKIVPADYDGDGKTDIAVYRASEGVWYIQRSTDGFMATQFGLAGDIPQPADYDGDGKSEIGVFRPSEGNWYTLNLASNQFTGVHFGGPGDKPVAGDYDGDGRTDRAVYRPADGTWYILGSSAGFTALRFGISTDIPVPADYDGDGKIDAAVFRNGDWYIQRSRDGYTGIHWGLSTDVPAPADFDGDGKADIAVFRPSDGDWWLNRTTSGATGIHFGMNGDRPTPSAFVH